MTTKEEIQKLWNDTPKVTSFKGMIKYILEYGKYSRLANFGAKVIKEYEIPYGHPKMLQETRKKFE